MCSHLWILGLGLGLICRRARSDSLVRRQRAPTGRGHYRSNISLSTVHRRSRRRAPILLLLRWLLLLLLLLLMLLLLLLLHQTLLHHKLLLSIIHLCLCCLRVCRLLGRRLSSLGVGMESFRLAIGVSARWWLVKELRVWYWGLESRDGGWWTGLRIRMCLYRRRGL
jgi:hypothetical protein